MSLLADLNDRYTDTAFRREVLRVYPHDPAELRSVRNDDYLRRVARHTLDGKRRDRVIAVPRSPTAVLLAQLDVYRANVTVGESIAVVITTDPGADFWLFDEDTDHAEAVVMDYDAEGGVVDREHVTDPTRVAGLRRQARAARAASIDLGHYLAEAPAHGVRRAG